MVAGLELVPKVQIDMAVERFPPIPGCSKNTISCSMKLCKLCRVQSPSKQLSIDERTVAPHTGIHRLGADSLDTVYLPNLYPRSLFRFWLIIKSNQDEIMMALEEKLGLSIGEGGAENIAKVQDAADLIERESEGCFCLI
ncbi:uncharacterized protein LOC131298802 [Rhododendron vialii]|uniref:uncharacterized protein LOC131298802 n=1 Tax=Rhododendron vialii TaxID=182163 RepID=UPI002660546D|nr:uncharacterized protein LOC131298802 [Rhododendron vialii]